MNCETWELYDPINFSNLFLGKYPDKQIKPAVNLLPNGKVLFSSGETWIDAGGGLAVGPSSMCYLYDSDGLNGIETTHSLSSNFKLYQSYPNPFNPSTT